MDSTKAVQHLLKSVQTAEECGAVATPADRRESKISFGHKRRARMRPRLPCGGAKFSGLPIGRSSLREIIIEGLKPIKLNRELEPAEKLHPGLRRSQ